MLIPKDDVLYAFTKNIQDVVEYQLQSLKVIDELTTQRDELLPLLMNGQVSVTQPAVNCDLVGLTISVIIAFPINLRNNISSHF
jgi:hypothetical protein